MIDPSDVVIEDNQMQRLAFHSLGFFRVKLRKRLEALGFRLSPLGLFGTDAIVVWGRKPVSQRGIWVAKKWSLKVVSIEDAFIRSIAPGWGEAPTGLIVDEQGIYYDAANGSDFIDLLENKPLDFIRDDVQQFMDRQISLGISKYNGTPRGGWTKKFYVLVIDQVADDASIVHGGADAETFRNMLAQARIDHPNRKILIRTHPAGAGHFNEDDLDENMEISTEPVNPWDVLDGAKDVYCVTSQMGFEAIMAGHKPHVFGKPFYAGWGLSQDWQSVTRRRQLNPLELYFLAMISACYWFDAAGETCDFSTMLDGMEARLQHDRRYGNGVALKNIRGWKRPHLKGYFPYQSRGAKSLRWGAKVNESDAIMEDGFLRSRGLGAKLAPPLSLIVDRTGIYFDPTGPSDLETIIHQRSDMANSQKIRAQQLRERIVELGLSKYNLEVADVPEFPESVKIILVPGQVEDDKSIILGATGDVKNSEQLLEAVRRDHPKAYIIYKPHPDVLAGLRKGLTETDLADLVYTGGSLEPLWTAVDQVATITSQTGFEALLRGKKVSTYGMPFYADWGLTTDYAPSTGRRGKAEIDQLVHATLIDYPIYYDPKARCISTPEIIVERLASGEIKQPLYLSTMTWAQQKFYRIQGSISGKNRVC